MRTLHVIPAYGRDYKSVTAIKESLGRGEDFQIADISSRWDGCYANLESLRTEDGPTHLTVRYSQLRKVVVIPLP